MRRGPLLIVGGSGLDYRPGILVVTVSYDTRFYGAGITSRDTIRSPRIEDAPLVVVIGQQTGPSDPTELEHHER